jgi:hypothetical protein
VRIEIDPSNGVDRYVLVGTGKLLDQADLDEASTVNTMYAIRDGTRTAPDPAPAAPWSRADLNAVDASGSSGFGAPAAGTRGWYQDATEASQKIVTDIGAVFGTAVFAFSKPAADPCGAALERATLFARDYATGKPTAATGSPAPGGTLHPASRSVPAFARSQHRRGSRRLGMLMRACRYHVAYSQPVAFCHPAGQCRNRKHRFVAVVDRIALPLGGSSGR